MPFALIWRTAPVGLIGVFLIGLANGPFWSLAPVYVAQLGFSPLAVGTFMTFVVVGGALFQMPAGMLSDRFDRRVVLVGLLAAALAFELTLGLAGPALPALGVDLLGPVHRRRDLDAVLCADRACERPDRPRQRRRHRRAGAVRLLHRRHGRPG